MKQLFKAPLKLFGKKRKEKKLQPPDDIVYIGAEQTALPARIIGLVLRTVILLLGVFGITSFICNAAGLTTRVYWNGFYVSIGYVFAVSLLVCAVAGFSAFNRKTKYIAAVAAPALYLIITAIAFGNPFTFAADSVIRIYNFALYNMVSKGYMYFGDFMLEDGYDYSRAAYVYDDPYRLCGVFLLAAAICLVLYFAMLKRVRLWVLIPALAIFLYPVLVFNLSTDSAGFAFFLAFAAASVALYVYDYRFGGAMEKKNARKKKRLEKKEARQKERLIKKAERRRLNEEADKILVAALKADMGRKKSRLARKAVIKANRLAEKNARKKERELARADKKQKKLLRLNKKAQLKKLKKEAAAGSTQAAADLSDIKRTDKDAAKEKKEERKLRRREKAARREQKNVISAAGGFAGLGAALVAFLAVIIPATAMKTAFPQINSIYNRVNIANEYVTSYLYGNDVDLNNLYAYGIKELTPRTLSFDPLVYEEKDVFKVSSTAGNNIYLRSWIGDSFDYYSDTWKGADYDTVLAYRQRFGGGFTPDSITTAFFNSVYPSTAEITEPQVYKNLSKFGFTVQRVDVKRLSGKSLLMFVPAVMDTKLSLLEKGTLDKNEKKYSSYYDGIYSSRFFGRGDTYGTVSFITRMNRSNIASELDNAVSYYLRSVNAIEDFDAASADPDAYLYAYEKALGDDGITYTGTSILDRYINTMDEDAQTELLNAVYFEKDYRNYAYEKYSARFGSERIAELAGEIAAEANPDGALRKHDVILSVIEYLGKNCTYSLTPDASAFKGSGSILEAFLFDVKNGHCSHFSTAACALLREYGYAVRYCEGYIAKDLTMSRGSFNTTVKDENAHAWIEVYYDGMGWVQYEVTPTFTEAMYTADSATLEPVEPGTNPDTPAKPQTPPATPEEEHKNDGELAGAPDKLTDFQVFIIAVSCTAAAILLALLAVFIIKRYSRKATNMLADRYNLIDRARDESVYKNPKTDLRKTARKLDDQILDIFKALGVPPEKGELSSDYGRRIAASYGNLSRINPEEVFAAIQKEEFGHGLSYDEMCLLAEYLSDITSSVYAGLSFRQKIVLRYIKRII